MLNRYKSDLEYKVRFNRSPIEDGKATIFDTLDQNAPEVQMAKPTRFLRFIPIESKYLPNNLEEQKHIQTFDHSTESIEILK